MKCISGIQEELGVWGEGILNKDAFALKQAHLYVKQHYI
jgi:hypothetical protein